MQLTETEKKIISILALKGYKTYYDFFKKEGMSSSTAWKLMDDLTEKGLVKVKKEEAFRIRGRKKKLYGLTFRGLVYALKIEGVKLHLIENKDELITSWVQKIREVDSELGISRLFGITNLSKDKRMQVLQKMLLKDIENSGEELEDFLRHFDLEHSSDPLIFQEWLFHVMLKKSHSVVMEKIPREKLKEFTEKWKGVKP